MTEGYIKYIEQVKSSENTCFNILIYLSVDNYKLKISSIELVNIIRKFRPYIGKNNVIITGDLTQQEDFIEETTMMCKKAGITLVKKIGE